MAIYEVNNVDVIKEGYELDKNNINELKKVCGKILDKIDKFIGGLGSTGTIGQAFSAVKTKEKYYMKDYKPYTRSIDKCREKINSLKKANITLYINLVNCTEYNINSTFNNIAKCIYAEGFKKAPKSKKFIKSWFIDPAGDRYYLEKGDSIFVCSANIIYNATYTDRMESLTIKIYCCTNSDKNKKKLNLLESANESYLSSYLDNVVLD